MGGGRIKRAVCGAEELLGWYTARKRSLRCAGLENLQETDEDRIFDLRIRHDRTYCGAAGLEIECGALLVARRGEPLWLCASAFQAGRRVEVRRGWEAWTDATDFRPNRASPERRALAGLTPVCPGAQHTILDAARIFLPYAALDLPAGRADLQFEVYLADLRGRRIAAENIAVSLAVPQRAAQPPPVPSPQSLGVWPSDVVSGSAISKLRISPPGRTEAALVSCDLKLYGQSGSAVTVECRWRKNSAGFERMQPPAAAKLLAAQGAAAGFDGLGFEFDGEELQRWSGGELLWAVVTAAIPGGRRLCGAAQPLPERLWR